MTMRYRTLTTRDRGSVLPIALVVTVVLAVIAVAIATYTATALRTSQVTEAKVDRLAAAEAGMQEALVRLEANGACPTAADLTGRNGATLTIDSCSTQVVTTGTDVPYSLILTALGLNAGTDAFVRNGSFVNTIEVGGQVYIALNATGKAKNVEATGNVISQATECINTEITGPAWLSLDSSECTVNAWDQFTTVPSIPSMPAASVAQPSGCTRVQAGTYNSLSVSGDVYFASGVYRITGPLTLRGKVTAGHNGTVTLPASHACFGAQTADVNSVAGTAQGAVFVLEGGGRIAVEGSNNNNPTEVEFYGLETDDRVLSLVAYTAGYPAPVGGYANSTGNPQTAGAVEIPNGSPNATFSFIGEVWAPGSFIDLSQMSSTGAAGAAFQGGAVISRFEANTSKDVSGLIFTGDEVPTNTLHRVRVTATADGSATTVSVIARQPTADALQIQSWRVL